MRKPPFLVLAILGFVSASGSYSTMASETGLHPDLQRYVEARLAEFDQIPADRRTTLRPLAEYVASPKRDAKPAKLTFICTHNSRRSHLAQVWAAVAAAYCGFDDVETFSGGTEATAFNSRAVDALRRAGFRIDRAHEATNPRFSVSYANEVAPLECFSKVYDHADNPSEDFCAVMTCSEADENCPTIAGAALRLAIPYDDPKIADDTPTESQKYDERTAQISREMLFVFSLATELLRERP